MRNGKRGRYTLEFKQEAVRLVESGEHRGSGTEPGDRGADAVELGEGASDREARGDKRAEDRDSRANGDQPFASRSGA